MISDQEYAIAMTRGDTFERKAEEAMAGGAMRRAQVCATLALSARLELLTEVQRDKPTGVEVAES